MRTWLDFEIGAGRLTPTEAPVRLINLARFSGNESLPRDLCYNLIQYSLSI